MNVMQWSTVIEIVQNNQAVNQIKLNIDDVAQNNNAKACKITLTLAEDVAQNNNAKACKNNVNVGRRPVLDPRCYMVTISWCSVSIT